jgi:hypothetical protein
VALPTWVVDLPAGLPREEVLPGHLHLPAVGARSLGRLVEQARRWTRARGALEVDEAEGYRPAPAELGIEEAWAVAEVVLLAHDGSWPGDDLGPDFEPAFGPPQLVDLPCLEVPGGLMDLVWGLSVEPALWRGLHLPTLPHEALRPVDQKI